MRKASLLAIVWMVLGGFLSSVSLAADFGADRHLARGVTCEQCHGKDKANPQLPDESTCLTCHNKEQVAAKTPQLKPNPHQAPHNGDCTLCHLQHEPEVNYCSQCHSFSFVMKHP